MRFVDEAIITLEGGHGGRGCISFRREKFVPRGGPDGGDGGKGGDITFVATTRMRTLQDFRYRKVIRSTNGSPGSGANKAGRDGKSIEIPVPIGTLIKNAETKDLLADLDREGATYIACKGGRGGKGNAHFATSRFQTPKFSQPGEEGEKKIVLLELKLLADVGIIGFPNAGKSTLISKISAARPKVADYPFTTLVPNLGVVQLNDDRSIVVADIPGLIEGAHKGTGLGHKFLKHIERTQVLVHLLNGEDLLTHPDPVSELVRQYGVIRKELQFFNRDLLKKREIIVVNKLDLFDDGVKKTLKGIKKKLSEEKGAKIAVGEPLLISAFTGKGLPDLLKTIHKAFEKTLKAKRK